MIKESLHAPLLKLICLLMLATTPLLLSACGGGGGGGSDSSSGSVSTTVFQAVDPYIVGAVFQEIAEDGQTLLQRSSTTSNAQGQFSFPKEVTPGSTIELKAGSKGLHQGTAYQGMLRYQIPASGPTDAVVSPLTTLEANGFTRQEIITLLSDAGLPGLTNADFNLDPMFGLQGQSSGITAGELLPLQANLAINCLLESLGNFDLDPATMNDANHAQLLQDIVGATVDTLNPTLFNQMSSDLGTQLGVTILIDDLIYAAVNSQNTMIARMQAAINTSGLPLSSTVVSNAVADCLAQTSTWMTSQAEMRGGSNQGGSTNMAGKNLYDANCSACHALGSYDQTGFIDLLGNGSLVAGKINGGHQGISLTSTELTDLSAWIDNPTQSNTGTGSGSGTGTGSGSGSGTTSDGATVYDNNCANCHAAGSYDTTGFLDLAGKGNLINAKLAAGHNNITLSTADEAALITWVDTQQSSGGTTTPPATTDGATLYAQECQGCHGQLTSTDITSRTVAGIEGAIAANLGGMGSINLTTNQVQAIVDVLPAVTTPDPGTTPASDGPTLYTSNCSSCHQIATYDNTGSAPDLGGKGTLIANKLAAGHMGLSLAAADIDTLATWLDTFTVVVVDPTPTDCTACHSQPPDGVDYPNGAGAHAVHMALQGIDSCDTCHQGAAHNSVVDLAFLSNYNAKSGAAVANSDSTCSNISCHGGKTTPNWWTGQLVVNSECSSCHASGTTQYNSYNSGDHSRHRGYSCTVCHNTTTLANQHFSNLGTTSVEGTAAATVGGGSTRVTGYSSGNCTNTCHSRESW